MDRRHLLLAGLAGLGATSGAGAVAVAFRRDLARAKARVHGGSEIFTSRFGSMEYAVAGNGPPVLMIHGTGGGFDQGLDFARPLIDAGWRVVAPSRFGYLRSAFPDHPSVENQADAFVDLLDRLGIDRVPAIGGSAGVLSAMQFAIRHPDRCSALVALVPAAFAPDRDPPRPPNMVAAAIIEYALKSDFLFWLGMKTGEDAMIASLLATDPALVRAAAPAERERVRQILHHILPVSARYRGLLNDARQAGTPEPMALQTISAPTLALSFEDDRFETMAAARHIADQVRGARLAAFERGGHVWVGRQDAVFAEIDAFLSANS